MCLLIFKPENIVIPYAYLQAADIANPHGCGIAYPDGKVTRTLKGAKWGADDIARALESIGNAPAIIHFRYATHGSLTNANTHPFLLPRGVAAAHNGIINGVTCRDDESDTRAYLRQHVVPFVGKGQNITDSLFLATIGAQVGAGNKLVFLDGKGRHGIANEASGHWHGGSWYSNATYQERNFAWEYDAEDDPDAVENWHEREIAELSCSHCGEHVTAMGYGKSVFICPDTAEIVCGDCARTEYRAPKTAPKFKSRYL